MLFSAYSIENNKRFKYVAKKCLRTSFSVFIYNYFIYLLNDLIFILLSVLYATKDP